MKPRWLLLTVSLICLFVLAPASALSQGPTVTAGCGTATIDGTLSSGEWETATRLAWSEEEHDMVPIDPAYADQDRGGGEVSPSQGALAGWLFVMNDANYLYLGTNVTLDSIAVDPDWWSGEFSLQFTDEGNARDNRWHADDCGPPPALEGDFVAWEAHGVFPSLGVDFHPWSEAGDCPLGPKTGVSFDAAPDGLAWEMRVNLNTSQLDKVAPGECFRFGSRFGLGACELGSGCDAIGGGNHLGGEVVWPEGSIFGDWPDTLGTLCLNPCEEEFVPEPGTILLMGSGLAGLAGYAALRRKTD